MTSQRASTRKQWFEDYTEGEVIEFGDEPITEEEILQFAQRYDPQPFHTDPEAASRTMYGGLIASGWMTAATLMRMMVAEIVAPKASLGSPGLESLHWYQPVRPGDRLRGRATVIQTRRSLSKPDRGVVIGEYEAINQHGVTVMKFRAVNLYLCRPEAA